VPSLHVKLDLESRLGLIYNHMMILFFSLLAINSVAITKDNLCGGTVQTFWKIQTSKSIKIKATYHHPKNIFCESSAKDSSNAEVQILDRNTRLIRTQNVYLSENVYLELSENNKMFASLQRPKKSIIQLKFANDDQFKKATYLKIVFLNGKVYGPAHF
jgi:hypothetical protein